MFNKSFFGVRGIRRSCNFALATLLSIALSAGLLPGSVRADQAPQAYLPGHAYVCYTADYQLSPNGDVAELLCATNENDGHVYDLYGNRVNFNADRSISNGNNAVVGFICANQLPSP